MSDDLRQDWRMADNDFEVLEIWIEGPISPSVDGFFQDVQADVRVNDLQDPQIVGTVQSLATLIWNNIPAANKG